VDDAMSYPHDLCLADKPPALCEDFACGGLMTEAFGRPGLIDDGVSPGVADEKMRCGTEPFDLATKQQLGVTGRGVERELDAG
jgi:hypothetical protein